MAKQFFVCGQLTGGKKGCLDYTPGYNLNDRDCAVTITNSSVFFHEAREKSYKPPFEPYLIKPRHNNHGRRWHLIHTLNSHNYEDSQILKGFSFFEEAPNPGSSGFVFWMRNFDLCVKIRNLYDVIKQFTVARFSEMEKIPRQEYSIDSPTLGKNLYKFTKVLGDGPNALNGLHTANLSNDDYAIVITENSLYFYVAVFGNAIEDFPNIVIPIHGSGFYWKLVGAMGDISFDQENATKGRALNSEPPNPPPGMYVMWMSNGGGLGDSGDFLVKTTNYNSETRYKTIVDFSTVGPGGVVVDPNKALKDKALMYESVEIVDKYVEAEHQDYMHTSEEVKLVDHSGVFLDDFAYMDDTVADNTQQIVIADYDEFTDTISYVEKVKYIKLFEYKFVDDDIGRYAFFQDELFGTDSFIQNAYVLINDLCVIEDVFFGFKAQMKLSDKCYNRTLPYFTFYLPDTVSGQETIVMDYDFVLQDYCFAEETLQNGDLPIRLIDSIDTVYESINILYYIPIEDISSGIISLSNNKQDIVVVEKPQITFDTTTGTTTPIIDAGVFRVSNGTDSHEKTDWVIYDKNMNVILKSMDDSSNLVQHQIPNGVLFNSKKYIVRVRFHGVSLGPGFWNQEIYET